MKNLIKRLFSKENLIMLGLALDPYLAKELNKEKATVNTVKKAA